ncbi:MAG: hypothetical protein Q9M11_03420 [Mariprofundaceae bacterium]|nr:hypothetical protein [Mariprofundaceae bacterium]
MTVTDSVTIFASVYKDVSLGGDVTVQSVTKEVMIVDMGNGYRLFGARLVEEGYELEPIVALQLFKIVSEICLLNIDIGPMDTFMIDKPASNITERVFEELEYDTNRSYVDGLCVGPELVTDLVGAVYDLPVWDIMKLGGEPGIMRVPIKWLHSGEHIHMHVATVHGR